MRTQPHFGFTIFELIIVLFLTGVVTVLGIISLTRLQALFKLRTAADEITAQIQFGREAAIANKGNAIYSFSFSGSIFRLTADSKEISRYTLPDNVVVSPPTITMNFTPITGAIPTCSPCQITLAVSGLSEVINIQSNGIVN